MVAPDEIRGQRARKGQKLSTSGTPFFPLLSSHLSSVANLNQTIIAPNAKAAE
jgi:hypothetical protein